LQKVFLVSGTLNAQLVAEGIFTFWAPITQKALIIGVFRVWLFDIWGDYQVNLYFSKQLAANCQTGW
jgi:hypothetical protein